MSPSTPGARILRVAALLVSTVTLAAQTPVWSSIDVSPAAAIGLEQSYAYAVDGNTVHACSTLNGDWTSLTTLGGPPVVTRCNEHFIVRDGPVLFYGYCPRTGSFSAQFALSAGASLLAQTSPQTWHSVLLDGTFVHIYFAYTGTWHTWSFATAPLVLNGRFCVVIDDGTSVIGISSLYETAVPLGAAGAVALRADGCFGLATSAGSVHGFSAFKNGWTTAPATGPLAVSVGGAQPGFAAIRDGSNYLFFSGHTGGFTTLSASAAATLSINRQVAVVVDGSQATAYSGLLGTATTLAFGATPFVDTNQFLAMLDDGAQVTPYSPLTGSFGPPVAGAWTISTTAQIATLAAPGSTTPVVAYSAINNSWIPVPAVANAIVHMTGCSIMLVDPLGGLHALSARGTSFVHEATPPIESSFQGSGALSGTLAARSGTTLWAFNPKTDRFRATTTASIAGNFQGQNGALILRDATHVYGFSNYLDRWASVALAGPFVSALIQTHAAVVFDGVRVHTFAGTGQLAGTGEYPDFWRSMTRGGRFHLNIAGESGAPMVLGMSAAAAEIPLGSMGTLRIDPASLFILAQLDLPTSGFFALTLQVPDTPVLTGAAIHFQALLTGPAGPYLTNSAIATIY